MIENIFHEALLIIAAIAFLAYASRILDRTLKLVRKPIAADNLPVVTHAVKAGAAVGAGFAIAGFLILLLVICNSK